jgi:hypothetical protein
MKMRFGSGLVVLALGVVGLAQFAVAQNAAAVQDFAAVSRPATNRQLLDACAGNRAAGELTLRASGHGAPYLNFCDGYTLRSAAPFGDLQPLSLASADFDGDGVPDLVSGYANGSAGLITIYRGNVSALWPYGAALRNGPPPSFLLDARSFAVPEAPSFIATGDFDADGRWDILTAKLGSDSLYFLRGDGHGGFAAPVRIALGGSLTTMTSGEINRSDGLTDLAVAIQSPSGPRVLVYESPLGALKGQPEAFPIRHPATSLALGRFDGGGMNDLAVAAGNQILVIHARDRKLSLSAAERAAVPAAKITAQGFAYTVQALVAGDFTGTGPSIAALGDDRRIHLLEHALGPNSLSARLDGMRRSTPISASAKLALIDALKRCNLRG